MDQAQLNLRIGREALGILEAAAFAYERTVPSLVRPLVDQVVRALAQDEAVQHVLRLRAETDARRIDATLDSLKVRLAEQDVSDLFDRAPEDHQHDPT
jgi:hypothetical protein